MTMPLLKWHKRATQDGAAVNPVVDLCRKGAGWQSWRSRGEDILTAGSPGGSAGIRLQRDGQRDAGQGRDSRPCLIPMLQWPAYWPVAFPLPFCVLAHC